jgi:polysaccharide pyruvyl transferase WcaK-like protein
MPSIQFCCIATGPEEAAAIHGIEAIPVSENLVQSWKPRNLLARLLRKVTIALPSEVYRWIKAFMILRRVDTLIIPGTGLLTDAYGLLEWGPYNLFRWCLTAKLCRCKLLFVSVGAGPIYGSFAKWLVKSALSLADFRSYRDTSSAQYLESIGFRTIQDPVYPDLAFSLPDAMVRLPATKDSCGHVVGLGLMASAGRYGVPHPMNETYLSYLENLSKVVKWLAGRNNDVNLLIGNFWDGPVRQELKRLLREQLSESEEGHIIDEPISCVEQLLQQLAVSHMVVATRYHNVLMALLNEKPVIAISFHPKCVSLMRDMGLSEYCMDINTLRADQLIEKIQDLEKNASGLKLLIRRKTEEFRKALDEQYKLIFDFVLGNAGVPEGVQRKKTAESVHLGMSQGRAS